MEATSTNYTMVLTERLDAVLRITLNRPEKRNALSQTLQQELLEVIAEAERDTSIRAIIIRGAGSSFCAGYDMAPVGERKGRITVEEDVALCMASGENWRRIWNCRVPVIAQVHGFCLAGGTDLALHCDLVIAADDAQFGFPPVRSQGTPPTHMWLYHCGVQWSKRLLLTGDTISGTTMAEVGLALEAVPAAELEDRVLALATRISHVGHDLLVHNKRLINLGVEMMGRGQMQTMAAISDVLGHNAPESKAFVKRLQSDGVRAAVDERDAPFLAAD